MCPHCQNLTGTPSLLAEYAIPEEQICDCFPVHGQYLRFYYEGQPAGDLLVDSDIIRKLRGADAVAPEV